MKSAVNFIRSHLKQIIIIASAAVVLLLSVILVVVAFKSFSGFNKHTLVYKKDGKCIVRIKDKELAVPDTAASDFKCDYKNKRVFYTVNSASSQDLFDIYYVALKNGEITKPKLIDYGVEKEYSVVSGNVYYLRYNKENNTDDGCVCDISDNKIETFSQNVEDLSVLENSGEIYFTKMHSNTKVLYRYSDSKPVEVCRDIKELHSYGNTEKSHIIYQSVSESGLNELYIAYAGSKPELICDNVSKVMYDDYEAGGNLYYFTASKETISWEYVIADKYAESDKKITKPKRNFFFSLFGLSSDYDKEQKEYEDKLLRDEIREALNDSMQSGAFNAPVFTAFVYNPDGTFKVADNVNPLSVFSVSAFGEPKLVYENSSVTASETDMSALMALAEKSTMNEVIEYAENVVNSSVKSNGITLAAYGSSGVVNYSLSDYNKNGTQFAFSSDGTRLYALVKDIQPGKFELYTNTFDTTLRPSEDISVDTGVSSYKCSGNSVVYMKPDRGESGGDIYLYDGTESIKLSNDAGAFMIDDKDNVIILKNYKEQFSVQTVDLYSYRDDEEQHISDNVVDSSFVFSSDGHAAYISADKAGNKILNIYCKGKSKIISDKVNEILLFE